MAGKKVITERDLMKVLDHAHTKFLEVKGFSDITPKQIQAAIIAEGIITLLKYEGIEPNFELDPNLYLRKHR